MYSSHGCKHVRVSGTASRDEHAYACTEIEPAAQVSRLGENDKITMSAKESLCTARRHLVLNSFAFRVHHSFIRRRHASTSSHGFSSQHSHSQAPSALTSDVYCKNLPACSLSAHSSTAFGSTHHSHERAQSTGLAATHHLRLVSTCVQPSA